LVCAVGLCAVAVYVVRSVIRARAELRAILSEAEEALEEVLVGDVGLDGV
jgi:hypothetical protein